MSSSTRHCSTRTRRSTSPNGIQIRYAWPGCMQIPIRRVTQAEAGGQWTRNPLLAGPRDPEIGT